MTATREDKPAGLSLSLVRFASLHHKRATAIYPSFYLTCEVLEAFRERERVSADSNRSSPYSNSFWLQPSRVENELIMRMS